MDHFPAEIKTNILSRFPSITYTLRCRSVCKRWRDIIDDHHFPLLQCHSKYILLPTFADDMYMVEEETQGLNPRQFKATKLRNPTPSDHPLSSNPCNGFIAFCSYYSKTEIATCYHIYLCNIVTQECLKLPDFIIIYNPGIVGRFLVHNLGLGFDREHKTFKLLITIYISFGLRHASHFKTQIFTLGSDSWRTLENFPSESCFRSSPVSMNGSLHWMRRDSILSFDLASETFLSMEMPFSASSLSWYDFRMMVLGESLSIIDSSHLHHIEVWFMKEYNVKESWSELVIKKRYTDTGGDDDFRYVHPISLGKINGEVLLLYDSGILVSFEVESGNHTPLEIQGLPDNIQIGHYEIHPY